MSYLIALSVLMFFVNCGWNDKSPVAPKKPNKISVSGKVTIGGTNTPLKNVLVSLWMDAKGDMYPYFPSQIITAKTDSSGSYELLAVLPDSTVEKYFCDKIGFSCSDSFVAGTGLYNVYPKYFNGGYFDIELGETLSINAQLWSQGAIQVVPQTQNPLVNNDSLYIQWPYYSSGVYQIADTTVWFIDRSVFVGDQMVYVNWKIKRNNDSWQTHIDSAFCLNFLLTQLIINY